MLANHPDGADRSGLPTAIVAYADLAAPDVESVLEAHAAFGAVRGIRQILSWHADPILRVAQRPDLMMDRQWRRGFALLRKFRMSFDLQIYWPQMEDAYRLACDFPDTFILLNHFGMPVDRSQEGVRRWTGELRKLARAPNVFVKLSGLGLGHPRWSVDDTGPLLLTAIEIFGVDRSMFGTNLLVDTLFGPAERLLDCYHKLNEPFSEHERACLFRLTAQRAYRI